MSHAKRYADKSVANVGRGPKTGNPRSDLPYSDAVRVTEIGALPFRVQQVGGFHEADELGAVAIFIRTLRPLRPLDHRLE